MIVGSLVRTSPLRHDLVFHTWHLEAWHSWVHQYPFSTTGPLALNHDMRSESKSRKNSIWNVKSYKCPNKPARVVLETLGKIDRRRCRWVKFQTWFLLLHVQRILMVLFKCARFLLLLSSYNRLRKTLTILEEVSNIKCVPLNEESIITEPPEALTAARCSSKLFEYF